jgi:hypothetical protein
VPFVFAFVVVAASLAVAYIFVQNQQRQQNGANVDSTQGDSPDFAQPVPADTSSIESAGIAALARGIARGEGFLVSGSLPQRSNNPGDLTKSFGNAVTGVANKEGVLIFATVQDGWNALYSQLGLIFSGNSKVYNKDMSIWEFAYTWTLGRQPATQEERISVAGWAASVLEELNKEPSITTALTVDSALGDIAA